MADNESDAPPEMVENTVKSKSPSTLVYGNLTVRTASVKKSAKSPSGINNKMNRIRKEVSFYSLSFSLCPAFSLFYFFSWVNHGKMVVSKHFLCTENPPKKATGATIFGSVDQMPRNMRNHLIGMMAMLEEC